MLCLFLYTLHAPYMCQNGMLASLVIYTAKTDVLKDEKCHIYSWDYFAYGRVPGPELDPAVGCSVSVTVAELVTFRFRLVTGKGVGGICAFFTRKMSIISVFSGRLVNKLEPRDHKATDRGESYLHIL